MKTVAFLTLGCKLNYAETSTYGRGLARAGFKIVGWKEKADIYIVNTCSVTATSDAKSRNLVRKVHRINPSAQIAVVGCSAQLRCSELESLEGVWRVFGASEKALLVPAVVSAFSNGESLSSAFAGSASFQAGPSQQAGSLPFEPRAASLSRRSCLSPAFAGSASLHPVFPAYSSGERTRSFLKVQDGCDNFCAYCTVPYARGGSRSVPLEKCVEMAREIASQGVKEIVLTGVNTGSYGSDTGVPFLTLLKELNAVDGISRYRISSIEPNLITTEIVDWIASGTKFQPHFHIPLQSGSDVILEMMGRHYTTAFFSERIEYIRSAMEGPDKPKVFFGIDLMVGLPGESDAIFEQSYAFVESLRPAFIHVFPYSRRPGTPASSMPGQVPEEVKAERVDAIERLCARLHDEFIRSNAGVHEQVLFESSVRGGRMEGYTGNYIRVERPYNPNLVNTLFDVVL